MLVFVGAIGSILQQEVQLQGAVVLGGGRGLLQGRHRGQHCHPRANLLALPQPFPPDLRCLFPKAKGQRPNN